MPLTSFQLELVKLLAQNRSQDSHLAGGAALHFQPNSMRYSEDLDYFHDSEERVASAFQQDRDLLKKEGYKISIELNQPGYIRCLVERSKSSTKIEWARDSSWRFMPVQYDETIGYVLHPIDLAVNKVLALAGRDEPRDYLDILHLHETLLPLGALCWAACGKDPGLSVGSLLELLKRRGKYRPEDFLRLHLREAVDVKALKQQWLKSLEEAENFFSKAPPAEMGCLYFSIKSKKFVQPQFKPASKDIVPHYGRPGGILPKLLDKG